MTSSRARRARDNKAGVGSGSIGKSEDDTCSNERLSIAADSAIIDLIRVIEREIIPRLFLTHLPEGPDFRGGSTITLTHDEIAAFAEFVLKNDAAQIRSRIDSLCDLGVSLQRIYLDLVAPAARYLREFGDQDDMDVDAVSRGLARLRQVLGEIGRRQAEDNDPETSRYPLM